MPSVLGIHIPDHLRQAWSRWLAPDPQPFFVAASHPFVDAGEERLELSPELRDTYRTWNVDRSLSIAWLTEEHFMSLSRRERASLVRAQAACGRGAVPTVRSWADLLEADRLRAQADGHRFVWWPSLLATNAVKVLARFVSTQRSVSRHREVSPSTWTDAIDQVPGARSLAGTFPDGSGPNCFGTVMAACGESHAAGAWILDAQFESWLGEKTRAGGQDGSPGTVLVWRNRDRIAQHAAVTIGDGWALEKPSQEWHSPRVILPVRDLIQRNRVAGLRLHRRAVITQAAVP